MKSLWSLLFIFCYFVSPIDGASCSTVYTAGTTWNQGQDFTLNFVVPSTVSSWTLVITFDSPVTTLSVWVGIVSCSSSTLCTVTNQNYNGNQNQNSILSLGGQTQFASTAFPPVMTSITFNGVNVCSNGPATTTTTTTLAPSAIPSCDSSFYGYTGQWTGGANGNFYIPFSSSVSSWAIQVQFSTVVNGLSVWVGSGTSCSGSTCYFSNASYNNIQPAGSNLSLGFQVSFNGSPAPNVIALFLNNVPLCSSTGGSSTTQAPSTTVAPITTTTSVTTTISTTAAPTTTTRATTTTTAAPTTTTQSASTTTTQAPITSPSVGRCLDYQNLLNMSMLFYEAQRSGKLPADQRVTWRKDSALTDKGNNGEDLTGGYYDAGDFVKFGFPMAYTMTVLAWGGVAYPTGYSASGQTNYLQAAVKWGTDYFIKAHVSPYVFYGQVGDGYVDHGYWGRPEDMTMARPAWAITTSSPGSDLAGETSAAMAAASILFSNSNPSYSATLLTHAKQLFTFADQYRGIYSNSISNAAGFYMSYSGYNDELVWAALWLYKATGNVTYLTYAKNGYNSYSFSGNNDVLSWDSKIAGVKVLLAQIDGVNTPSYVQDCQNLCNYYMNSIPKSPQGEAFFSEWGSLRYASNAAFTCLLVSDIPNVLPANAQNYKNFASAQMEYIIASTGRSFVIGFGNNFPTHPHHRSSSCPNAPNVCDHNTYNSPAPNYHTLYGALVGGPAAANDQYTDVRSDFKSNEVAMDYNAGFQSLVAGLRQKNCPHFADYIFADWTLSPNFR